MQRVGRRYPRFGSTGFPRRPNCLSFGQTSKQLFCTATKWAAMTARRPKTCRMRMREGGQTIEPGKKYFVNVICFMY